MCLVSTVLNNIAIDSETGHRSCLSKCRKQAETEVSDLHDESGT